MYSLYRNPDLDDRIFYCLPASMAAVQAEDVRASFLFVGDLNVHHQEWLGLLPLTSQRSPVGPTHARGGTFDLLMTDVPDHFDSKQSREAVVIFSSISEFYHLCVQVE